MDIRRQPSKHFLRRLNRYHELSITQISNLSAQESKQKLMPTKFAAAQNAVPLSTLPSEGLKYMPGKIRKARELGTLIFRIVEFAAAVFVIPAAYVLLIDLEDRQTQRIAQAWQLVTQNAPGNSGKIQALEYLNSEDCHLQTNSTSKGYAEFCSIKALFIAPKQREPLRGIDLSEEAHSSSVYLQGVDLSGADLYGADLSGAELQGANLQRANLRMANLANTNLREANLTEADLERSSLLGAGAWGINLSGTILKFSDLSGAYYAGADFSGAYIDRANMSGADLFRTNMSGADFRGANLSGAILYESNLLGAYLRGANLSGSDLTSVNLSGANFSEVQLSTASPYRNPLTRKMLMGQEYDGFPWPPDAQSGAFFQEGFPPEIDLPLLVHFISVGDECTWVTGLKYVKCAEVSRSTQFTFRL